MKLSITLSAVLYFSAASARGDTYALVIGVNEVPAYHLADDAAPRSLRGAEPDARLIADILQESYRVPQAGLRLLLGREATLESVRMELGRLAIMARPTDTIVIHFSGHGTQRPDALPFDEADDLDEALCLYDARADGAGLLLDDELGRLLEAISADDVIVVLDCCHAGTGIKDDDGIVPRFLPQTAPGRSAPAKPERPWREVQSTNKSLKRQTTAFFACRPEQQAYERRLPGTTDRVGQFSHYFWTGLRDGTADADNDGLVSRGEAIKFAAKRLDEAFNVSRSEASSRQTPIWEGEHPELPFLSLGKPQ